MVCAEHIPPWSPQLRAYTSLPNVSLLSHLPNQCTTLLGHLSPRLESIPFCPMYPSSAMLKPPFHPLFTVHTSLALFPTPTECSPHLLHSMLIPHFPLPLHSLSTTSSICSGHLPLRPLYMAPTHPLVTFTLPPPVKRPPDHFTLLLSPLPPTHFC